MRYDAEVKISLKKGMLNPEATTIEKALALLKYQVENTKTLQIIKFSIEGESEDIVRQEVDEMCQRLLCNPVIQNYEIGITPEE
ncbi:MAG TPA: phosphoribosylformylglycinamidine synthase subunit PurS [Methanobacterium sp.]|jgi:phosphoribosylformylglycinamidine synthase|nr:MAG: phosphoribosylformylglycinamidine synthase subunit PurS [Methanobacterium sp.]HOI71550.1 phosphoribosylformylglycinamidine synthase subunit PurS [Methanobacterium sp.]